MKELRLVPSAAVCWLVALLTIISGTTWLAVGLIVFAAGLALFLKQPGQVIAITSVGMASAIVAWIRLQIARSFEVSELLVGTVASTRLLAPNRTLIHLSVSGYPTSIPVFVHGEPEIEKSAIISITGEVTENDRIGIADIAINASQVSVEQEPVGYAGWVNDTRDRFAAAVQSGLGEHSHGLVPGMVLGDTRMQDAIEQQTYLDTGLSHLSAVSGANVAIVTTSVVLFVRLFTVGPRFQLACAAFALVFFVSVVGTEPSVLRAAVTGVVGLLAVLNSARMEPMHGLSLAVISLVLWDSDLAAQFGFILSVAATAGIVVLFPLIYHGLARFSLPDMVARAIAVAIAADVVTMPIVAVMAGRVSVVAVIANVLVAAAVAPITIIGLIALILMIVPGSAETIALKILEPFSWWIYQVADWCQGLPIATISIGDGWIAQVWVLVICIWMVVALKYGLAQWVLLGFCSVMVIFWQVNRLPAVVDLETLRWVVIESTAELDTVPRGTELIVVTDPEGSVADRPNVNQQGVPVLFPNRDGEVTIHVDGTQHAADGRF